MMSEGASMQEEAVGARSVSSNGSSEEAVRVMPKAEVHVHLEGCFDAADLVALADQAGRRLPVPAERLFEFDGLASFLAFLDLACGLVTDRDQLARAAYRFAEREAASGVVYADLIVNPIHWSAWTDDLAGFIDGIDAGLAEAEQDGHPPVGLCVSLLREQSASEAQDLVDWLIERRHPRVVALSIDGNEAAAGRTGPRFAEAFARAASVGLHRTVHAGESSGPEGVRDAIDVLQAERIDHGVRVSEDPALVREVADLGIPLGICVGSNIVLGLYPDRASHPIDALRNAGVRVSVNTDDPSLLRTSLTHEYVATARAFGWDLEALRSIGRTSIEASFCPDELRRDSLRRLQMWRPS
jgi:adenosine deaminase